VVRHGRETLVGWLGEREGTWLHERGRGIDRAPVETNREAKSVSRDETFATDLMTTRRSPPGCSAWPTGQRRRA